MTIDTAIGYGESQRVLGRIGTQGLECITKLPSLPTQVEDIVEWVQSQIAQTLLDLGQEKLYGLLLHKPGELLGPHGPKLARALRLAKDAFNIQKLGVSVYEPQELLDCWSVLQYDIVQLPCNIFDQRFAAGPALDHLESHNIEVHARSIFLQGLLLMPEGSQPAYFNRWAYVFNAWYALANSLKRTQLEVCLAFASQQTFVHKWVIGFDSKEQFTGILSSGEAVETEILAHAWARFKDLPLELISPSHWDMQCE